MSGLVLERVTHAFGGAPVVCEVSLAVRAGELVCLLGPSGCGKSTILRIAAGLESLQQGRVLIEGREVAGPRGSLPPERRNVGLMFQDFALFPHLRVIDNVAFGLGQLSAGERRAAASAALGRVGMLHAARAYPHKLSGGEQQRAALARALAPQPRVMLLDEPFSDLDVQLRDQVRRDTLHVLKEAGTPTLMVTHDPEEALLMADRIALMRAGRIVQEGAPMALYRHPVSAFCAAFLGETVRLEGLVQGGRAATVLGAFAADGLADGTAVEVLIRPEALSLRTGEGIAARIVAVRGLGPAALVRLRLEASGLELSARIPGNHLPAGEARVALAVDPAMAFVFPAARG